MGGEVLNESWALEWEVTPFSLVPLTWVLLLGQDQSRTKLGKGCAGWSEGVPRSLVVPEAQPPGWQDIMPPVISP